MQAHCQPVHQEAPLRWSMHKVNYINPRCRSCEAIGRPERAGVNTGATSPHQIGWSDRNEQVSRIGIDWDSGFAAVK